MTELLTHWLPVRLFTDAQPWQPSQRDYQTKDLQLQVDGTLSSDVASVRALIKHFEGNKAALATSMWSGQVKLTCKQFITCGIRTVCWEPRRHRRRSTSAVGSMLVGRRQTEAATGQTSRTDLGLYAQFWQRSIWNSSRGAAQTAQSGCAQIGARQNKRGERQTSSCEPNTWEVQGTLVQLLVTHNQSMTFLL